MSDSKNENQNSTCHGDDREHSIMGTGRTVRRAQKNMKAPGTWFLTDIKMS